MLWFTSEEQKEETREEIGSRKAFDAGKTFTKALTVTQEEKLHKLITNGCTLVRSYRFIRILSWYLQNVNLTILEFDKLDLIIKIWIKFIKGLTQSTMTIFYMYHKFKVIFTLWPHRN